MPELRAVRCDLCGADEAPVVARKRAVLYDETFTIVRCKRCGLVYVNPRLDDATIETLYDAAYYRGEGFDRSIDYARDNRRGLPEIRAASAGVVETLREALGGLEGRTALDIGCGLGGLVRSLQAEGARAMGTDSSAAALEACAANGTPLAPSLDALLRDGARFDAVTAIEVIEHTTSPRAFIAAILPLVKPGGVLLLGTGNWNHVRHVPGTPYLMPEGHIYYFTPVTMRKYFALFDLEIAPVTNRLWVGWRALAPRLGPALPRALAGAVASVAPGYGPFPVARVPAKG